MKNESKKNIQISLELDNKVENLIIEELESTDGAPYYNCSLNGNQITQIRKDDHNNWKQLWGSLNETDVNTIGNAIEESER